MAIDTYGQPKLDEMVGAPSPEGSARPLGLRDAQAVEERNHAMMIVQYFLDRDMVVHTPGIDQPENSFADYRAPIKVAPEDLGIHLRLEVKLLV